MKIRFSIDTLIALTLFLFSIFFYFYIPTQVVSIRRVELYLTPIFYPNLLVILLGVLSFLYLLSSIFLREDETIKIEKEKLEIKALLKRFFTSRLLYTLIIFYLYTYLLDLGGFFIATPIVVGALMFHMGNRNYKKMVVIMIVLPIIIYLIFEVLLNIYLPRGPLYRFF